jgi:hypothetical protein
MRIESFIQSVAKSTKKISIDPMTGHNRNLNLYKLHYTAIRLNLKLRNNGFCDERKSFQRTMQDLLSVGSAEQKKITQKF